MPFINIVDKNEEIVNTLTIGDQDVVLFKIVKNNAFDVTYSIPDSNPLKISVTTNEIKHNFMLEGETSNITTADFMETIITSIGSKDRSIEVLKIIFKDYHSRAYYQKIYYEDTVLRITKPISLTNRGYKHLSQ